MSELEIVDAELVATSVGALDAPGISSEMLLSVEMARRSPRDIGRFRDELETAVTTDRAVAEMCFYSRPQGGEKIQGPSVRLAELAQSAYRNIAAGSRPGRVDRVAMEVTGIGWAFDMERNTPVTCEVVRSIRTKHGRLYQDSMIPVTMMAACAIARRNAILQVIPRVYINAAYQRAIDVFSGGDMPLAERRARAVRAFADLGADESRVLSALGKPSMDMLTVSDIVHLRGLFTAIKDGVTCLDDALPIESVPTASDIDQLPIP